jgi:hypothetical protein
MMTMTGVAAAEGERTPMIGAAVTYSEAGERQAALVGGELELVWWSGRFGLGAEAAARRAVDDDSARSLALAGSARVLVADWLWPSLLEPRDVEVGIELQLIGERTWWSRDVSSDAFGVGAAFRMRGGSDWELSSLLAESRLFVRVMRSTGAPSDVVARTADAMPAAMSGMFAQPDHAITVMVGLGAAFGAGTRNYLDRFRLHMFDMSRE